MKIAITANRERSGTRLICIRSLEPGNAAGAEFTPIPEAAAVYHKETRLSSGRLSDRHAWLTTTTRGFSIAPTRSFAALRKRSHRICSEVPDARVAVTESLLSARQLSL